MTTTKCGQRWPGRWCRLRELH